MTAADRAARVAPLLVGAVCLGLHAATACPTVYFGDGGELIAASYGFALAHPPGYPLYTLIGWIVSSLPGAEPARWMNVLSALFAAATCAVAAGTVRSWTGCTPAAWAAGAALAVSSTFWSVAVVAEVYTLHLLLLAALLLAATLAGQVARPDLARRRALVLGAVALGLGLAHHPTIVLGIPPALLLALGRRRGGGSPFGPRVLATCAALVLSIPVALYATLPLRTWLHPEAGWGRLDSLDALWRHVSASGFRGLYLVGPDRWLHADPWSWLGRSLLAEFSWTGAILAAAGLASPFRRAGFALFLLVATTALFALSYAVEDASMFLLPALLGQGLAIGLGVAWLARGRGRVRRSAAGLAAAVVVLVPLASHARARSLAGVTAASDYSRDVLAAVPTGGVLFVEGDNAFLFAYHRRVLGERPDIRFFSRDGILFDDELGEPGSPPRPDEPPLAYRVRREIEFVLARPSQPVLFLTWPGYDLPGHLRFEPWGLLYRVRAATEPAGDDRGLWAGYHEAAILAHAERSNEPQARTIAAFYPLMRGERSLFLRDRATAFADLDRASAIATESETVHNYLGAIFGRLGDYERAAREFARAVEIKPVSVRAWANLGQARWLLGDASGARRAWQRSLELDPFQPDVRAQLGALGR